MSKYKLIILFNHPNKKEKAMINSFPYNEAEILNLSDEIDSNLDFKIPFIDRQKILLKHQNDVIDSMINWCYQKGAENLSNTENIKQLLKTSKGISLWWFNELQLKNFDGNPLYNKLIFINIIEELLLENKYDEFIIFGGDNTFRKTILDLFGNTRLKLSYPVRFNGIFFESFFFCTGFFKTLAYIPLLLMRIFFIKYRYKKDKREDSKINVSFLGSHPCSLLNKKCKIVERYYGTLPARLKEKGLNVNFISVFCEMKENRKDFNKNYIEAAKKYESGIIFLETLLSIKDIISVFKAYTVTILRFYFLPSRIKTKLFIFKGKKLYRLLGTEFFRSLYSHVSFVNLLISESAYIYSKKFDPDCLISCYAVNSAGRAINHGFRRDDPNKIIVSIQHASMTKNKVICRFHPGEIKADHNNNHIDFMPMPDYYITQGSLAYDLMITSGFAKERCFVCGSPRFDALYEYSRILKQTDIGKILPELRNQIPSGKKILLIATSFNMYDSIQLIDLVFKAANKDHFHIFKPHPNCPVTDVLGNYSKNFQDIQYLVSDENANELIMLADVVISTYSTVVDEAVAIGKPAISVHAGVHINMSSFESLNFNIVKKPEELRNEINNIFSGSDDLFEIKRNYLIEKCFGKFDGRATERVMRKIFEIKHWQYR